MSNVEDLYPLTPLQQGMLFHTLHAPEAGVYVERLSWSLRGDLDVAAFRRAWGAVVARHAILRSAFLWEGLDEPLQAVRRQVTLPWREEDWRAAGEGRGPLLEDFLRQDLAAPFDLARPTYWPSYRLIANTLPAPTVLLPSRIAKRCPTSMAMALNSSTDTGRVSPGITRSMPSGKPTLPVTSVVRK